MFGSTPWLQPPDAPARFRSLGLWGEQTLAEIVDGRADLHPDKVALVDTHVRLSYRELRELSRRIATVLLDLGVAQGDPVAVQLPGCALLPALHLACVRVGALFLPLSPDWRGAELGPLLRAVPAPVLIVAAGEAGRIEAAQRLRAELPTLRHVITAGAGGGLLDELASGTEPLGAGEQAARRTGPDAPAHVMCSSGTTGLPKASVWSGNDVVALLRHHVGSRLRLNPDDIAAGIAPAGTGSTGYVFPVLAPLLAGATSVILERWSPEAALELIVREGATYATAIPTQMIMMLDLDLEAADLSRFTRFNNAGAPLAPSTARELEERMGCRVQTIYGATDGGVPVMTSVDDPDEVRRSTVGSVCPGVEVRILGADGTPQPTGEPGEVCWRGPGKSYGYLNEPDYDALAWDTDGFFHSGDLGRFGADANLRIVGRVKDMILRGGTNIFPAEIELLVVNHPAVADVCIVGIPDRRLGERACAVVVAAEGTSPTLADLCEYLLAHQLAKVKLPEELVLVDAIPTNAGGKVDKAAVRSLAARAVRSRAG